MQYLITFLEGVISFISPCVLPLLPVYISYFAANTQKKHSTVLRAFGFVLGFTLVFCILGLFAGTVGSFLIKYRTAVNIISGLIVILLGLNFLDIIHLPFFGGTGKSIKVKGFFSAFLFGMVFSVTLTPCVGAFLGSALMMASGSGTALRGLLLLLAYSAGMGIPFLASAILTDKLSAFFGSIKKHYRTINIICGIFLISVGILMMFGMINIMMNMFS